MEQIANSIHNAISTKEGLAEAFIATKKEASKLKHDARVQNHRGAVQSTIDNINNKNTQLREEMRSIHRLMDDMVNNLITNGEEMPETVEFINKKKNDFDDFLNERNDEVNAILKEYENSFDFTTTN